MPRVQHVKCPFCHEGVAPRDDKTACNACMGWHHQDCWAEHGSCASCGNADMLALPAPGKRPEWAVDPFSIHCPRCDHPQLQERGYEGAWLLYCRRCWGSWLPQRDFYGLVRTFAAVGWGTPDQPLPPPHLDPELTCLVCRQAMSKFVWRSLVLDTCRGHGLWLDSGEILRLRALVEEHPGECQLLLSRV